VTSIGGNAFYNFTSLLPPSLSARDADPAAVLAYLKRKSKDERVAARYAIYASALRARSEDGRAEDGRAEDGRAEDGRVADPARGQHRQAPPGTWRA
jgi:hypothetical protein